MEDTGDVIIEVRDLVKVYGATHAVNGVSFDVREGEVFGLLGENGAGKTTALEIIEGLRQPTGGTTRVFGLDSRTDIARIRERIGVQLQASAYFEELTLFEILDLFGSFYRRHREPEELLSLVNLQGRAQSRVGELSGGMRQRFSLVAALVNDPELVFFDEPTTGLDPLARQNIWELIRSIQAAGKTLVLTSHYLEEVESLCGRVGILKDGELIALDRVSDLVMTLADPIRVDFLPRTAMSDSTGEFLEKVGRLERSTRRAGEFTLYLADRDTLKRAIRELDRVDLDRLTVSTANLEDVFVKLTGGTIRVEEES
ncbi:MAG: ABC transporter ATP-binding protein [Actinobacteria bacterium]|nr:ABC transporter ATP-binding protein [Actinomycetota bacterium]MBU1942600.1 ABC transporter ATP-binding protein [Actinomycetota bacterium]MBU2688724.1 ABC transporter ATP-binding protein [Actinomycetota bacterium]